MTEEEEPGPLGKTWPGIARPGSNLIPERSETFLCSFIHATHIYLESAECQPWVLAHGDRWDGQILPQGLGD